MPGINRECDITEKKEWFTWTNAFGVGGVSNLVKTGQTFIMGGPVPYPGTIQSGKVFAAGVSNAMQISLGLQRFAGGGLTLITVGLSNIVCSEASSGGPIGFSGLPVPGSTLLSFLAGDCFLITTSVANAAVSSLALQLVVVKTQDIVSHNGIQ